MRLGRREPAGEFVREDASRAGGEAALGEPRRGARTGTGASPATSRRLGEPLGAAEEEPGGARA